MNPATIKVNPDQRPVNMARYQPPAQMPLLDARLCVETTCETVFDSSSQDACPRCGSRSTEFISRWLNRKPCRIEVAQ